VHALRGLKRVTLAAGESRTVHFDLSPRDLSSVTEAGERIVAAGTYRVAVGGGQPGSGGPVASRALLVAGQVALPQ